MKRLFSVVLVVLMALSALLAACSNQPTAPTDESQPKTSESESQKMVVFADPVLEAMVCGAMGKSSGGITVADAGAVTRLDLSFDWQRNFSKETPIKQLDGLECFTNLESLDLSGHAVTDISPLAGLRKLTLLALGGNPIADISPLAGLTSLKMLILTGCAAQDYSPLAALTSLEMLMLDNSTIADATPLASLTNLKRLYLAGCKLDYSPLEDIYSNLEDKDFVIPHTLVEFGFYMDHGRKQAIYEGEQVDVRINHEKWGEPDGEWMRNCVRTVFGTDKYKVDIGYYPEQNVYVVVAVSSDSELNYLYFPADGNFSFGVGDRESSEGHIRAIFPNATGEDLLLAPINFYITALEDALGMTATELFALPFEPVTLRSLGFGESEEVQGYLYVHNKPGDYFDVSIHDPKQEAWVDGGEVRFFMPLSEESRVFVSYHVDGKWFSVRADDNDGGGALYDYYPDSDKHVDKWSSDKGDEDSMTVEQYFIRAINDPAITHTSDVYQYAVNLMVKTVEATFGMGLDELYALPVE